MGGFLSGWAKRVEPEYDDTEEATNFSLWISRQHQLSRERRVYHDRLATRWLIATFGLFVVSQIPGPSFFHWTTFLAAIPSGVCAYANWVEARAAALAADTWPQDY